MDGQAVSAQHLTGQDQMFVLLQHAPDATRARFTPHCDESERLPADAQVLLVGLPPFLAAHLHHPLQVFWIEEGLRGSAAARFTLDVVLPFALVERSGCARGKVALDKGVKALFPCRVLAGSLISSIRWMTQQETGGQSEKSSESSHDPEVLHGDHKFKELALHLTEHRRSVKRKSSLHT